MTRRRFLSWTRKAAAFACGSALLPRRMLADPLGLPVGIQLWTVREPMATHPAATLAQLSKIGYRKVESAGYGTYTAREYRKFIDDAGLKCPSAHLPFSKGIDFGPLFEQAHLLGCSFSTSSKLMPLAAAPALGPEGFRYLAELMNDIGAKAQAAGLQYAYHNHSHEFEVLPGGTVDYDFLLNQTDKALVKFEIDCGWMVLAGHSPAQYMQKYPGRFRMLHIKDFEPMAKPYTPASTGPQPIGSELGKGHIGYKEIFTAAKSAGIVHVFAEQEPPFPVSQLDSARVDYDYLHSFS